MRVLAAMSGGVDSAVAAARAVDAGHDVVGVHLALARNPAHPAHRRPRLLHDRGRPRRPPRRRRPRHPLLRLGPGGAVRARRRRGLRRRVRRRPHAQPVRAVQRADQVLRPARQGARARLRRRLHRPLRAAGARPGGAASCTARSTPARTSPTCSPCSPRSGSSTRSSRWGTRVKADVRREAARARAAARRQARLARHLLRRRRRHQDLAGRAARAGGRAPIVDAAGEVVGEHDGAYAYTVGQRHGLRLGRPAPDGRPRYVLEVRPADDTVVVGPREQLDADSVEAAGATWCGPAPAPGDRVGVQVRAHGEELPGVVEALAGDAVRLRLDRPVRAAAPGQTAALYAGHPRRRFGDDHAARSPLPTLRASRTGEHRPVQRA